MRQKVGLQAEKIKMSAYLHAPRWTMSCYICLNMDVPLFLVLLSIFFFAFLLVTGEKKKRDCSAVLPWASLASLICTDYGCKEWPQSWYRCTYIHMFRNHLCAFNTDTHNQSCSCASVETCNQTGPLASSKCKTRTRSLSLRLAQKHTHPHAYCMGQCTKICHFISRNLTKKIEENDCMLFTKHVLRYTQPFWMSKGNQYLSIGCGDRKLCWEHHGTQMLNIYNYI